MVNKAVEHIWSNFSGHNALRNTRLGTYTIMFRYSNVTANTKLTFTHMLFHFPIAAYQKTYKSVA